MPSTSRSARGPKSVGLISDTHGLLRPEALAALQGSRYIVHAGDIGDADILAALEKIAPVTAVRGNNDTAPWARKLRDTALLQVGRLRIYVIHDLGELDLDPASERIDVVVSGHSHRPKQEMRDGVLFVNPGSAGPRRFKLPIALARLELSSTGVRCEEITLG